MVIRVWGCWERYVCGQVLLWNAQPLMAGAQGRVRFSNGEKALCVKRWLNRTAADSSGLTFENWNPSEDELDPNAQPAFMIVNSSEVRGIATLGHGGGAKAELQEVLPAPLQGVAVSGPAGGRISSRLRNRSASVQNVSPASSPALDACTYALRPDIDNTWRERCE